MASSFDLSKLQKALPTSSNSPGQKDLYTNDINHECVCTHRVLLWNIHGDSSAGMAEARNLLVGKVVEKCNPDVLLLQEVKTQKTIDHIKSECQSRSYSSHCSAERTEACIMYNTQCFEFVYGIDLPRIIGDTNLQPHTAITRSGDNPSQLFYNKRSCAIRLRHRGTRKELVLISFHNASTRTAGVKANVISSAKGFLTLVYMVHAREGVPVIAGGDFNCDRSDLLEHARSLRCELPDYYKSERRTLCEKIDLYILKSSTSIDSTVEVYEALPLADPTSAGTHNHPLDRESIGYLVRNAPVKKNGEKLTLNDYTKATNHDCTLNTVTVNYPKI